MVFIWYGHSSLKLHTGSLSLEAQVNRRQRQTSRSREPEVWLAEVGRLAPEPGHVDALETRLFYQARGDQCVGGAGSSN